MRAPESYTIIDIETDGLPKDGKRGNKDYSGIHLLEVAALPASASGFGSGFSYLCSGGKITPDIGRITGLTQDDIDSAPPAWSALSRLSAMIRDASSSSWIVGHNLAGFDLPILLQHADLQAQAILTTCHVLDTMLIWRAWMSGQHQNRGEPLEQFWGRVLGTEHHFRSSLEHVYRTLIGPIKQVHRALDDCRTCGAVLQAMIEAEILEAVLA